MRVLITGSWKQHNSAVMVEAMNAANMIGVEPTAIFTGCWVGADQLGMNYAKKNGIDHAFVELHKEVLPNDVDAVIIVTHRGEHESGWLIDSCELLAIECVVW